MPQLKIVICDNDEVRVRDWKRRVDAALGSSATVVAMEPPAFALAVGALKNRASAAKLGEASRGTDEARAFDEADVLILDSDLTPDPGSDPGHDPDDAVSTYLAGELGQDVARLVRFHTSAGAVVVVNQAGKRRTFDLTMMRWAGGPADVYITADDVDNDRLWRGSGAGSYRPWSWPVLERVSRGVSDFTETVGLDDGVLASIGFDEAQVARLSYRQLEALSSESGDGDVVTFRAVAQSPVLGMGIQPKEREDEEQLLRVAVWGVRRWLDRFVVPPQNLLTDLPHLLQDRPWHAVDRSQIGRWNDDERIWAGDTTSELFSDALNARATELLGRQVWNVGALPPEESAENRVESNDPVFCEDSSTFVSADDSHDFESDLEGPFTTRFVQMLEDVDYSPRHRLFL
ncbi:hypothetical protein [Microbacterium lacticum]